MTTVWLKSCWISISIGMRSPVEGYPIELYLELIHSFMVVAWLDCSSILCLSISTRFKPVFMPSKLRQHEHDARRLSFD